ncbi:hypothetical protein B0H13DRAFT_160056 [Mycena leptocephala]|nr:hypothetical protein B0H13DRAFT_160056 [Mycena leptocephala]
MTDAGSPLLGLLASTVITNVVWLLGLPILVSMVAYCIAGSWLSYQQHPRSARPNLLTPLQYGLLFKLFSAAAPAPHFRSATTLRIANRASPHLPSSRLLSSSFRAYWVSPISSAQRTSGSTLSRPWLS